MVCLVLVLAVSIEQLLELLRNLRFKHGVGDVFLTGVLKSRLARFILR